MPLYEYFCHNCHKTSEQLISNSSDTVSCPHCGGSNVKKLFSAHSSMSGRPKTVVPGPGDTACCGSAPGTGQCAGPGSCCGKA